MEDDQSDGVELREHKADAAIRAAVISAIDVNPWDIIHPVTDFLAETCEADACGGILFHPYGEEFLLSVYIKNPGGDPFVEGKEVSLFELFKWASQTAMHPQDFDSLQEMIDLFHAKASEFIREKRK